MFESESWLIENHMKNHGSKKVVLFPKNKSDLVHQVFSLACRTYVIWPLVKHMTNNISPFLGTPIIQIYMLDRSVVYSKLPVGVNVSVKSCLSFDVSLVLNLTCPLCIPLLAPMSAQIGARHCESCAGYERWWTDGRMDGWMDGWMDDGVVYLHYPKCFQQH